MCYQVFKLKFYASFNIKLNIFNIKLSTTYNDEDHRFGVIRVILSLKHEQKLIQK